MKGYDSLQECVKDYVLLCAAKKMSALTRKKGENVVSYLEKNIRLKRAHASKKFKQATKNYTKEDFQLIAINSAVDNIDDLHDFLKQCPQRMGENAKIKCLLKSSAFRNGHLKLVYDYLPQKITSSKDLIKFICEYKEVTTSLIKSVSEAYQIRNWQSVLRKAEEDKLIKREGRYWGP